MFKPSQSLQGAIRRLRLTTKQKGKDYYKGNRTGTVGRHTKHGGFIIEWHRVKTYVCPDLSGFTLTPFVTKKIEAPRGYYPRVDDPERGIVGYPEGPLSGRLYLERWKEENGKY